MSDTNSSDPLVGFDQTNGQVDGLDGESDGTVEGEDYSSGDRGPSIADQDSYMAETLQQEEGENPGSVAPEDDPSGFRTGD